MGQPGEFRDNVVLIGFMAVGKGRTARELYRRTRLFTVDTDDLIETAEKRKIKEIFDTDGEAAFRALEARWARWLERSVRGAIISTGGGFFMVPNLRAIGTVVLLEASLEDILAVIHAHPQAEKKIRKRPLLADMDAARALYEQRLPRYRAAADLVVQVGRGDVAGAAEAIITALDLPRR